MTQNAPTEPAPTATRRQVLAATGVVVAAAAATAACGSSAGSSASAPASSANPATSATPATPATVGTASVPVGGGVVLAERKIVVTQPVAGEFKAFSAVCTHQGCVVSSIADGKINCACHGSMFSAADGSVQRGPATSSLAPVNLTVSGDQITLA